MWLFLIKKDKVGGKEGIGGSGGRSGFTYLTRFSKLCIPNRVGVSF